MKKNEHLSVTELNFYIKSMMEGDEFLCNIFLEGEVSNFKRHSSGHLYFSLKDEKSIVRAVMFSSNAKKLRFEPKDGSKALVYGSVSVYAQSGQYQVYACDMLPLGKGEINEALKKLREKLEKEGLFDESKKRAIKKFPKRIGVVTSATGAVIHDITTVLARRWPLAEVVLCPVRVQGSSAPEEILAAFEIFNKKELVDTIIIGRGGGSKEELWAFNDEAVVRSIANLRVPVISAVGHDTDFTLCDFAADLRAPTPSAAAELASADSSEVLVFIENLKQKYFNFIQNKIRDFRENILEMKNKMNKTTEEMIHLRNTALSGLCGKLSALNPLAALSRGFTVVSCGDILIKSVKDMKEDMNAELVFADGRANFTVKNLVIDVTVCD
jgi:exodeoxyribonuclease VII large subunit